MYGHCSYGFSSWESIPCIFRSVMGYGTGAVKYNERGIRAFDLVTAGGALGARYCIKYINYLLL